MIRVRLKRLDGLSADQQEKIFAVLLSRYPAIQPSSQELKKNIILCRATRDTPIRGTNDTPGRTRPILPQSDTPFSARGFSLICTNWRPGLKIVLRAMF